MKTSWWFIDLKNVMKLIVFYKINLFSYFAYASFCVIYIFCDFPKYFSHPSHSKIVSQFVKTQPANVINHHIFFCIHITILDPDIRFQLRQSIASRTLCLQVRAQLGCRSKATHVTEQVKVDWVGETEKSGLGPLQPN